MIVAHVAGVPVEEMLPTAATAGAVLAARAWTWYRDRRYARKP